MIEIRSKARFIGAEWVDGSDADDKKGKEKADPSAPKRAVRLLDYGCGTGLSESSMVVLCVLFFLFKARADSGSTCRQTSSRARVLLVLQQELGGLSCCKQRN